MREISLLKGFAVAPRDGNAAAGFGKDLVIIKVIDIGQVHQVAAVALEEPAADGQALLKRTQRFGGFHHLISAQIEYHPFILGFSVFDVVEIELLEAEGGLQHHVFRLRLEKVAAILQGPPQPLVGNGLEQVILCPYFVGFQGKFRRGGQKDDFYRGILRAQLPRGIHPVQQRHHNIQQDDIHAEGRVFGDELVTIIKGIQLGGDPAVIRPNADHLHQALPEFSIVITY